MLFYLLYHALTLLIQLKTEHVLADATYKIIIEGFPVLTVGTTDKDRHFIPFGCVVNLSKIIFICKAFNYEAHSGYTRINCWAHCSRLIDNELANVRNNNIRFCMRKDIHDIQVSDSAVLFDKVKKTLINI